MIEFRVEQEPAKPGTVLMAEDRELLERAEQGEIGPTLRFYEWEVPTLSIGFHQGEDGLELARLSEARVPWVRRPTGGAAVLHSEELTYAVVLPRGAESGGSAVVQEAVARAISAGLRSIGVAAETDARGEPLSALSNRISCFVRTSRWEVTAGGRKIVGSAQRKLSRAILQHGSILTGDDHLRIVELLRLTDDQARASLRDRLAAKSTSVSAELGRRVTPSELREPMERAFRECFASMAIPAGV